MALVYKRMGNLRACQLLLGHTKLESTVWYFGIEVDDALAFGTNRPVRQAAGSQCRHERPSWTNKQLRA